MKRRLFVYLCVLFLAILSFGGCNESSNPVSASEDQTDDSSSDANKDDNGDNSQDDADNGDSDDSGDSGDNNDNSGATGNSGPNVEYTWDSATEFRITLNGDSAEIEGEGAWLDGSSVIIAYPGTYILSGSLDDGRIIVDSSYDDDVILVLDNVVITSSVSAPIYIANAGDTEIVLADNSSNYVTDPGSYTFDDPAKEEPNAAIFGNDDIVISGNGSLTVTGNFNDGITSEDDLKIKGGTIHVTAKDDGIRGKDSLKIKGGSITVESGGDGLKSDNETDSEEGNIEIENGIFDITSGGDALTAVNSVLISYGTFALTSGGGSTSRISDDLSAKGIKGVVGVTIDGGVIYIDGADDAIHSNGNVTINNGTLSLCSGDDAVHADDTLEINGGEITVTKSYEGLESATMYINDGIMHIISSDDGINVAGGNDGSGFMVGRDRDPWNPGGGGGGEQGGDYHLYINGGFVSINAEGDGLDSNGTIEITGGTVLVNGPTNNGNGSLDYASSCTISGGLLIAAGSSGMAQAPGTSSSQNSVMMNFRSSINAGTLLALKSSSGDELFCFEPSKRFQSLVFSSPGLIRGSSYSLYTGGSSSGTETDGYYTGGEYTSGTQYVNFTVSGVVTNVMQ